MSLPIIGLTINLIAMSVGDYSFERFYINRYYADAIVQAAAVPLLLPITTKDEIIERYVDLIDGLLLTGGHDVNPLFYGEQPHNLLTSLYPERDKYELKLIKKVFAAKKPIFAICRGMQILNVAFGGTLYQDITLGSPATIKHMQQAPAQEVTHTVTLIPDSILFSLFKRESISVNSFHHQAIKKLATGFSVCAIAPDGILESIERKDYPFMLAVQWHPEMLIEKHAEMRLLFKEFVAAANSEMQQNKYKQSSNKGISAGSIDFGKRQ